MIGAQILPSENAVREAGEEFDDQLTKTEASKRIDERQERTACSQNAAAGW